MKQKVIYISDQLHEKLRGEENASQLISELCEAHYGDVEGKKLEEHLTQIKDVEERKKRCEESVLRIRKRHKLPALCPEDLEKEVEDLLRRIEKANESMA